MKAKTAIYIPVNVNKREESSFAGTRQLLKLGNIAELTIF